jgi:hypothetical protein
LACKEKPVVAALKWFECCNVHSKLFVRTVRPLLSKINQFGQWPYRLLQRQHILVAAGFADSL